MLFQIFGILLSSAIAAVALIYKFTGDLAPKGLKRLLNRIALRNWQKTQPRRIGFHNTENPKGTDDTGILPCHKEELLELPRKLEHSDETDELNFFGIDDNGNGLYVEIKRFFEDITEAKLHLRIGGVSYSVSRRGQSSSQTEFVLGNFKLEMVDAMRCWRIWYNGILRHDNNGGCVHVRLNFLWKPFDSPLDTRRDLNLHLLSNFCSTYGSFGTSLFELSNVLPDGYRQFGALHGTIQIDNGNEERSYLYGFRNRKWERVRTYDSIKCTSKSGADFSKSHRPKYQLELFAMSGCDGNAFSLSATNEGWIDGQTLYPSSKKYEITNVDAGHDLFFRNSQLPKLFTVTDSRGTFIVEIRPNTFTQNFPSTELVWLQLTMNGKPGRGLLVRKCESLYPVGPFSSIIDTNIANDHENIKCFRAIDRVTTTAQTEKKVPEIVSFKSEIAKEVGSVGGKGASLASLCQQSLDSKAFSTAKGFCVTTTSFKQHLPVDQFKQLFSKVHKNDLDNTCNTVMKQIVESNAKDELAPLISSWITDIFGRSSDEIKLAVRSSGVLEDGAELSCAGQNETFLGIRPQDVPEKVVACWASLFTPQSVRYRLNHGQPAVSEMAVVVQEMVHAKAAGVLFTADPRTGNPLKLMISANYGLGESVVSAACDPDTIILNRFPSTAELQIGEKTMGKKKSKVVIALAGDTTEELEVDEEESTSFCISDDLALELGRAAIAIESELGHLRPVDIEWAVDKDGNIFVLQCRPVTSLEIWTDFELIHEADSAYNTMFEWFTHANTGEVMPGVTSPLSLSVVQNLLDVGIQIRSNRAGTNDPVVPYALKKMATQRYRVVLNVLNALYPSVDKEITTDKVASDLSIFGHRVMDEELHALALQRHGLTPPLQKIRGLLSFTMTIRETKSEIKKAAKLYENYTIPLKTSENSDAKKLYSLITERLFDLFQIANVHCMMSEASTITQMFALLTLAQGRKADDWDSDIYEDVSKVLSVCMDVESADLPSAMDRLATTIVQHGGSHDAVLMGFVEQSPSAGFEWLSHHTESIIPQALADFFEKHGHRCICELDMMRKSWKSDPIPFVNLLQSLVRNKIKFDSSKTNGPKNKKYDNDEALLSSLHTKLGFVAKSFLKFLLPYCREAVWNREKTKSYFVRTGDQLKQCYERLAHLMVQDQLLPEPQLIYYMTHQDIGRLLSRHAHSPKILYKAMRKMKLFPELNKEEYPEITIGIREPVERKENVEYGDSLKATPVSSGKVTAPAKVCRTIEEASKLIEPGDILITHGTDIGWSPFFPILGGIVTELGGLISHGAVVAREYGLPCIVGAGNATKIFKTGELILLDAGKGIITKVKVNS